MLLHRVLDWGVGDASQDHVPRARCSPPHPRRLPIRYVYGTSPPVPAVPRAGRSPPASSAAWNGTCAPHPVLEQRSKARNHAAWSTLAGGSWPLYVVRKCGPDGKRESHQTAAARRAGRGWRGWHARRRRDRAAGLQPARDRQSLPGSTVVLPLHAEHLVTCSSLLRTWGRAQVARTLTRGPSRKEAVRATGMSCAASRNRLTTSANRLLCNGATGQRRGVRGSGISV